jgi:xylan 1,4-beta-xylosidase
MGKGMENKMRHLLIVLSLLLLPLESYPQTTHFMSFTYQGEDARFNHPEMDGRQAYLNPIVSGFYPDPSVVRVGKTYWMVNSTFGYFPGVPLFKSTDLVNWHQVGNVLDRPSQINLKGAEVSGGIFAPQISYNPKNKTYYMTTMNMTTFQVFYVKSKNPESGWSEPVQMKRGGMDTSFFFDTDGRAWVVYCSRPFDKNAPADRSAIHMNEFDRRADSIKSKTWELTTGSGCMEKARWIEGPHLYHIGRYYYLLCAEGGTERLHSEVVFRSKKITGPWESYEGNPILTQRDLPDTGRPDAVSCAGHADLVKAENGQWWAVFLGCRPYGEDLYNTGRETFLLPVTWKNGWPVILPQGESVPTVVAKPDLEPDGENQVTGNLTYRESFHTNQLGPQWIYLRNPVTGNYRLNADAAPGLDIIPTEETLSGKASPSAVFFRQKNTTFTADATLSFQPKGNAIAELALFQSDKNHLVLGITLQNGQPAIVLTLTRNGQTTVIGSRPLTSDEAGHPISLRVRGEGRYYSFFVSTDARRDQWQVVARGVDCVCLSKAFSGGYVGTTIGLYASLDNTK